MAETIAPWIPLMGVVAGGIVVGIFNAYNRRRGAEEAKMPSVAETWLREERQAVQLAALHTAYARLRGAFSAYVYRVRYGGDSEPTEAEKHFLTASSVDAAAAEQPQP